MNFKKFGVEYRFRISLFFLVIAGILINPYEIHTGDHAYKIPLLKAFLDPTLYQNDLTIMTLKKGYTTLFPLFVYPFWKMLGLEVGFYVIHCLTRGLFYVSVYLIGRALTGEKLTGIITVVLLLVARPAIGGIETLDMMVTERGVSFSLFLLSLWLVFSRRDFLGSVVGAIAASIHIVTAANVLLFLSVYYGVCACVKSLRYQIGRRIMLYAFPMIIGIVIVVWRKIASGSSGSLLQVIDFQWLQMIYFRSAHHFYPDLIYFTVFLCLGVIGFFMWMFLKSKNRALPEDMTPVMFSALISLVLGCALGLLFGNVYPLLIGFQLSFFRISLVFIVLFSVLCAHFLFRVLSFNKPLLWASVILVSVLSYYFSPIRESEPVRQDQYIVAEKDVQVWLQNNTPKDALVLTPPYVNNFRSYSDRAILGSWKDWTYNCLDRDYAYKMRDRLVDTLKIRGTSDWLEDYGRSYYLSLKKPQLLFLANKYGVNYMVMENLNKTGLESVYKNELFTVYKT